MIRLNFLPSWIYEQLPQVGVLIKLEDQKDRQSKSPVPKRQQDIILHTCPKDTSVFRNWEIRRKCHKYAANFGVVYLVFVGQCPRCLEIFWDVLSCDPEELGWADVTAFYKENG